MSIQQLGWLEIAIFFAVLFAVYLVCGVLAYMIAPDRPATFFWVTFLMLGPLGVLAALIAPLPEQPVTRRKVATGRRRFICPRCGAENDIPEADKSYICWRCSEHNTVEPAKTVAKVPLARKIDAKLADFEAGRISVPELESYLNGVQGRRGPDGKLPHSKG